MKLGEGIICDFHSKNGKRHFLPMCLCDVIYKQPKENLKLLDSITNVWLILIRDFVSTTQYLTPPESYFEGLASQPFRYPEIGNEGDVLGQKNRTKRNALLCTWV
jgi:hypothetical protein